MKTIDDIDFDALGRELQTRIDRDDSRRTRRHRIAAGAVVLAVGLATTGAALAVARAGQHEIDYSVECYGGPSLDARHGTSDYGAGAREGIPMSERIDLAVQQCSAAWRVGTFESDHASTTRDDHPVPPLRTCGLPDGRLAVFPSTRSSLILCPDLGLATPAG